jgi:tyrosyl-tRNA synthetase
MQCTDIFFLKADICQLGVDQRKVNMLAREYCDHAGRKLKPIILSHHMLYGLKENQAKMSKSDPDSALWMEDSEADIRRKLQAAFCPREATKPATTGGEEESIRLVEDTLQNPCLDYLRYIVFCLPGSTFEAGGKVFTDFESAKAAFLSQELSEADLKEGLIVKLNQFIKPVREHFETNPEAQRILNLIKEYKKEALVPVVKFRRLSVSSSEKVHVVFSPLASEKFTLGLVLTIVRQLEAAPEGSDVLFWVRDWSSFCCNSFLGDKKAIAASFHLLLEALSAVAPDLMAKVKVIKQSEAILSNPSDYWISVINVGRKFLLPKVTINESDGQVSQVIANLMHVGDVLATGATTIACTEADKALHQLAVDYHDVIETGLPVPSLTLVAPAVSQLRQLPQGGCDDPSIDIFLVDNPADVAPKIKKAFCEPQNVQYCPPLTLAREVCFRFGGEVVIKRKPDDGGDKAFKTIEELTADFAAGTLHPADLKPPIGASVISLVTAINNKYKTGEGKNALNAVKNFVKKQNMKKK